MAVAPEGQHELATAHLHMQVQLGAGLVVQAAMVSRNLRPLIRAHSPLGILRAAQCEGWRCGAKRRKAATSLLTVTPSGQGPHCQDASVSPVHTPGQSCCPQPS